MKKDLLTIIARYSNMNEKDQKIALDKLLQDPKSITYAYDSFDSAFIRGAIDKCISLSSLMAAMLKKKAQSDSLSAYLQETNNSSLIKALSLSSPKLRKNVARVMGALNDKTYSPLLVSALNKETQQYVRPSLVQAIGSIGEKSSIEFLEKLYDKIDKNATDKNKANEIQALSVAIMKNEKFECPTFTGLDSKKEIVLRTMPGYAFDLKDHLLKLGYEATTSNKNDQDVMIMTDKIESIFDIRTFSDLYFLVGRKIPLNGKSIYSALAKFGLISFLKQTHTDFNKMYYRIEIPGTSITQKTRSEYIKEISLQINKMPGIHDNPYNYQFELLIEPYSRSCDIYINLKTIKDSRFDYRVNTLPASINPYIAAIVSQYIKKYAKNTSKVLDPFCGTGTMLIERAQAAPYSTLNGVDIKNKAIEFATENSDKAGLPIEYTNSDILRYKPNTKYTEVLSNMPFGNRVGTHAANIEIYEGFFKSVKNYLEADAILALYTMEGKLLETTAQKYNFEIIEKHKMYAGGLRPTLYILK